MSIATRIFCRSCLRSDTLRDAGLTIPENIHYIGDLKYGEDQMQTLDVCWSKDIPSRAVIVNVHGGGYVYGSTLTYRYYCCELASKGYTVVSFNYRLAPKHIFPTPLLDLELVMKWICAHADEYPIDVNNILMVGDSAGAQLTSQYAAIYSSPEYADIMNIHPGGFRLASVGLNCGMYDISDMCSRPAGLNAIVGTYFTGKPERFGRQLRVLDYITADYPPAYLLSSHGDFLLANCEPMARLLRSHGAACEYWIYGDKSTGHVFHIDIRSELARQANADELEFMSRYII